MHSKFFIVLMLCFSVTLSGCDLAKNQLKPDREAGLEIQDYRDALASRLSSDDNNKVPYASSKTSLELQPYIADTSKSIKAFPLVSISVNQSVPLKDILFELANQADYDLELDPRIRGSIIFTARERPFDQVIERIADVAGLRYNFDNDVLRVELDSPYGHLYKIDFLNFVRTNSSGISNDISVVSGEGADTGSSFEAGSESESNFWGELEANLTQILGGVSTSLRTRSDPRIIAEDVNPDVQAIAPPNDGGAVEVQPPEAVLRVDSLPIDGGAEDEEENISDATFTLNRQAGLINVFATEKAHKKIREYLRVLKQSVSSQVLIEAKILEVSLNDTYSNGIEWRAIDLFGDQGALNFFDAAANLDTLALGGGAGIANGGVTLGVGGDDFQAVVQALQTFGTIRALASPRLTVLNNQSAVLNVATNRVFFEIEIDRTEGTDGGGDTIEIDSDIQNVPEGVLVNVQPSINLEDRSISLAVRPTITRVVREVPDPGVEFAAGGTGIESLIPELNVQEIDSVIQVNSGRSVVMGGLLQDRVDGTEESVPVLGEIPGFGALFRDEDNTVFKTELVILLKATILDNPSDSVHNTDKDLYRQFSSDRRPFRF